MDMCADTQLLTQKLQGLINDKLIWGIITLSIIDHPLIVLFFIHISDS